MIPAALPLLFPRSARARRFLEQTVSEEQFQRFLDTLLAKVARKPEGLTKEEAASREKAFAAKFKEAF